jgi:trehalose/maltose hydrolase-like predicted phosphorylase
MINNIAAAGNLIPLKQTTRKINTETIIQFQLLLKNETWETVYKDNDTSNKFNSFFFTVLNISEASCPIEHKSIDKLRNDLITQGIKISCKSKICLYIYSMISNDPNTRAFYIKYCKILNNVIKEAKKQHYSRLIAKSHTNIKTTWNIVKKEDKKSKFN